MVHAGCVFVAGIHPSRKWLSGSFESVQWNACVHRLNLCLYSHPKEFWGNGVRTHGNSKGKVPSTGNIFLRGGPNQWCCIKQDSQPNTLPTELFRPYSGSKINGILSLQNDLLFAIKIVLLLLTCFFHRDWSVLVQQIWFILLQHRYTGTRPVCDNQQQNYHLTDNKNNKITACLTKLHNYCLPVNKHTKNCI